MQLVGAYNVAVQGFNEWFQQSAAAADPIRQRRPLQLDTFAGIHLRLAIQRLVIAVLGHQDVGQ
jgi:hypothetical protein